MTDKLSLYNGALTVLGERNISTLAEDVEPRRAIDNIYADCILECLEASNWVWAMRAIVLDYDTNISPDFGFNFAYQQPSDLIKVYMLSDNENFGIPLEDYVDEAGYWYAWVTPLYARYVSNDPAYGGNLANYTSSYARFVKHALARSICRRITSSEEKFKAIVQLEEKYKKEAIGRDGLRDPVAFPPYGTWASSRRRRIRDRTPTSTLIG